MNYRCIIVCIILSVLLGHQQIQQTQALVNVPPIGARIVRVGVMSSGSGVYAGIGSIARSTRLFWQQYIYDQGGIGSEHIYPLFIYADVASSPNITMQVATDWYVNQHVDLIFGPENYLSGVAAAYAPSIPVIASISGISFIYRCDVKTPSTVSAWLPPCERPYGRRFLNLFSAGNVAQNFFLKWFGEVRSKGARSLAMVQDGDSYNQEICMSGVQYAQDYQLKLIFNHTLRGGEASTSELNSVMTTLKHIRPDVILWCNRPNCAQAIQKFYEFQYYPPALMTIQCIDSAVASSLNDKLEFVMGASTWDDRLRSATFQDNRILPFGQRFVSDSIPSAQLFKQKWMNYSNGLLATSTQVGVYTSAVLLEAAVVLSNSTKANDIMQELPRISSYSFAGELRFDPFGVISSSDVIIYQYRNKKTEIVSPANEMTLEWVYPAPSWEERIFGKRPFQTEVEQAFIVIIALINVFNLIYFAGGFVFFRSEEHIKAISWLFSLMTVTGCVLLNFALLSWGVQNNQAQCDARLLLLVGFALQICPINAKLFRLDAIFNSKQLRVSKMNTVKVFGITLAHLCLFLVPIIVWTSIAPFKVVQIATDPLRKQMDYTECATEWIPFGPLILVIGGAMLLEATILAYMTRNIDARFRESKALVETFYFVLFPIGVSVVLQALLGNTNSLSREAMFAIRSSLLIMASEIYLFKLFGTHIRRAWGNYTGWAIFADASGGVWGDDNTGVRPNNVTVLEEDSSFEEKKTSKYKLSLGKTSHIRTPTSVQPAPLPGIV